MFKPYLLTGGRAMQPGQLNLVAVPRWLELALKAKNLTMEQALAARKDGGFDSYGWEGFLPDIMSVSEVQLHEQVSYALEDFLFPGNKPSSARSRAPETRAKLYADLVNQWHAVPMVKGLELNLHPVILGSNLIGMFHVEAKPGVTDTDLYGRILRCAHTLVFNKIGMAAFNCELVKDVLYEISVGQQLAA